MSCLTLIFEYHRRLPDFKDNSLVDNFRNNIFKRYVARLLRRKQNINNIVLIANNALLFQVHLLIVISRAKSYVCIHVYTNIA